MKLISPLLEVENLAFNQTKTPFLKNKKHCKLPSKLHFGNSYLLRCSRMRECVCEFGFASVRVRSHVRVLLLLNITFSIFYSFTPKTDSQNRQSGAVFSTSQKSLNKRCIKPKIN